MKKKVVIVTAGGHIASFHAGMKGIYNVLNGDYDLVGARGGVSGLLTETFAPLAEDQIEVHRAGSLFGTDRTNLGSKEDPSVLERNIRIVKRVVDEHSIDAIIMMGGDNHLGEAAKLHTHGIPTVGFPKTMDGDLGSDISLGYVTAATRAAEMTMLHHSTAITSSRVFFVGLFGRNTDWVPVAATAFGHGDLCIPCEKNYSWNEVAQAITGAVERNFEEFGVGFAVIPYSEGASIDGLKLPDTVKVDSHGNPKLSSERLGDELVRMTTELGYGACFEAHTYSLRDSPPQAIDVELAMIAGQEAAKLILERRFGLGIRFTLHNNSRLYTTEAVPLETLATQRRVRDTNFFNYDTLQPTPAFVALYGPLFSQAMEIAAVKPVYRNMRPNHTLQTI